MSLTLKRILILFSVCLNIGFLASAAHHALTHDDVSKPRRHFTDALDSVEMSDVQRRAMVALEDRLHANMIQFRQESLQIKKDNLEALTLTGGPDQERMDANLDEEVGVMRRRLKMANDIFMEGLDILGPEKLRQFGNALVENVGRR